MRDDPIDSWINRLQAGVIDLVDIDQLERVHFDDTLARLEQQYPIRFQERRQGKKLEVGLARQMRRSERWATTTFAECLTLTWEGDSITTLELFAGLRVRDSRRKRGLFELTSHAGFSLYHDVDGWKIKLLKERTISLTGERLHQMGWLPSEVGTTGVK